MWYCRLKIAISLYYLHPNMENEVHAEFEFFLPNSRLWSPPRQLRLLAQLPRWQLIVSACYTTISNFGENWKLSCVENVHKETAKLKNKDQEGFGEQIALRMDSLCVTLLAILVDIGHHKVTRHLFNYRHLCLAHHCRFLELVGSAIQ